MLTDNGPRHWRALRGRQILVPPDPGPGALAGRIRPGAGGGGVDLRPGQRRAAPGPRADLRHRRCAAG